MGRIRLDHVDDAGRRRPGHRRGGRGGRRPQAGLADEVGAAKPASTAVLGSSTVPQFQPSGRSNALDSVFELALLLCAILFMIWLRRAATLARRAGLPAARSPIWAALGFIVPVVNYWFPHQVARDLFPPGHPGRALAKRWWTLWIVTGLMSLPIFVVALFSVVAAVVVGLAGGALAIWCALVARQMIAACGQAHASLLGH